MGDEELSEDSIKEARRREDHLRRLGTREPRCSYPGCAERQPSALNGRHPSILCSEHAALLAGRTDVEYQHPSGWHNDPDFTLPILGNDHRVWDDAKRDWPERTLRNPDGSPLLKAAAAIRSVIDWFRAVVDRVLGWIPKFLEWLDESLRSLHGDRWWIALGWSGAEG